MDQKDIMDALATALEPVLRQKVQATGVGSVPYVHGPGSLFGIAGLERDIIHTRVSGSGLLTKLPLQSSQQLFPMFDYITGFLATTGTKPSTACAEPETAGSKKTCVQTAPFGRYAYKTREIELERLGELINRGEFTDLRVLNDPIVPELGNRFFPQVSGNETAALALGAEVLQRFIELGVAFANRLGEQLYIGSPANNSGTGYMEFMGLDQLISLNKVDAILGTDCPSLWSDVKNFNYKKVDATAQPTLVYTLTTMWRILNHTAEKTGLKPATWVIVMRQGAFWAITDVWPCAYYTHRCTDLVTGVAISTVDAGDMIRLRDDMRNNNYLLIDGTRVPVIIDDYIAEESSGDNGAINIGCFASDIYIVPLTAMGGMPVTYLEYFDFSKGAMVGVEQGRASSRFWSDGGIYLWTWDTRDYCLVHEAVMRPRLIMRTPHIAGRLTNVQYCLLQHERDVLPTQDYFVDGGVQYRLPPSLYSDWNAPGR